MFQPENTYHWNLHFGFLMASFCPLVSLRFSPSIRQQCYALSFDSRGHSTVHFLSSVASSIRSETYWYSKQLTAVTNWHVWYQVLTVLCKTVVGVQFLKFIDTAKNSYLTNTRQACAYCPVLKRMQLTCKARVEALKKSRQQSGEMSERPVCDTVWRSFRWSLFLRVLFVTFSSEMCAQIWPGRIVRCIISHAQNTNCITAQCIFTGIRRLVNTSDEWLFPAQTTVRSTANSSVYISISTRSNSCVDAITVASFVCSHETTRNPPNKFSETW